MSCKVLVCGGRDYRDMAGLFDALDGLHRDRRFSLVIHGAASGADSMASLWAETRGLECEAFPAQWAKHGNAAGPLRNQQMLDMRPDLVVAFPGGRGTADMVRRARKAGVAVVEIAQRAEPPHA